MESEKKVTMLGRELTFKDIENIQSPALQAILKERFLEVTGEQKEGYFHTKHSDHHKYEKYSRFPYCGLMPGD